uniref:Malectin-like domain-containing protein n=1 Tax=Kalanchoe fedtschenkoi TaxID=63787 RepID=A0A7N0U1F9_KALFE
MALIPSLLILLHALPLLIAASPPPAPAAAAVSLRIDCGGNANSTDAFGTTWLSDRYFTAGYPSIVSEPLLFRSVHEKTLRFFPISSGKKNCYVIPSLPDGRYFFRTFIVYDNYDGKSQSPSFDVSVEGTLVFSWRSPWSEGIARNGAYSDLFAFVKDGEADVCFYSIATDPPVIASLEVLQIDQLSYDSAALGDSLILVNYGRLSCGSSQWGPGFSNDSDRFSRSWQSDVEFRSPDSAGFKSLSALNNVKYTDQAPNYFPMKLYQEAVTVAGEGPLEYDLQVDAKMDYLLWFHFAEIDSTVNKAGKRVFDVMVNGKNISRVDIYDKVGGFAAYDFNYVVKNLSNMRLNVKLLPVIGKPIISGLENYALVPADLSTRPEQVAAMRALKGSLRVPDRMGWNGDPCAPTSWDAWEGVTCRVEKNSSFLVIVQIDLGIQGLKGYISDQISLLTNLVSLNLSYNSLGGGIPPGLGHSSLTTLDLSNNRLMGFIPESLYSTSLQLVRIAYSFQSGDIQNSHLYVTIDFRISLRIFFKQTVVLTWLMVSMHKLE